MSTQPTPSRADPLSALDDLADFQPRPQPKPRPAPELVREVSEGSGFPSRAPAPKAKPPVSEPAPRPPQRRRRTGRNIQLNMKVTQATVERMAQISDEQGWPFGETLERALDALAATLSGKTS